MTRLDLARAADGLRVPERLAGIFPSGLTPARHYGRLEKWFLAFASDIGARASVLDALMWDYMRRLPHLEADDSDT